jgi:hypothetical protein
MFFLFFFLSFGLFVDNSLFSFVFGSDGQMDGKCYFLFFRSLLILLFPTSWSLARVRLYVGFFFVQPHGFREGLYFFIFIFYSLRSFRSLLTIFFFFFFPFGFGHTDRKGLFKIFFSFPFTSATFVY